MTLDSYLFTCQGGRSYNQDSVGSGNLPDGAVYIVADGLGGHLHGEMASKCAVDAILSRLPEPEEELTQWLTTQISNANSSILELQKQQRSNMKTTVAALVIQGANASWANVGDSRVYYLHNRALDRCTADHSVAYKKYISGEITRAQIATDEDQSSLLRTLGNPERNKPDCDSATIQPGDGFLLCSDGMWEYILDEEILVDFLKADSAQTWGELLQLRAMERITEGNDNISIITVMIHR